MDEEREIEEKEKKREEGECNDTNTHILFVS